ASQMDVTPQNLLDNAEEFRARGIPVTWMIMDDMWGDVPAIDRPTMHSRELNSFEAAPERFPKGLAGVIGEIKEQYGIKVGMWHPITGYWHGIDPNGDLAKEHGDRLEYTIPRFADDGSRLMHSFDPAKAQKYYDIQHRFYKDCGAEFVKVDNQGSTEYLSYHKGSIGETSETLHNAVEKAVKRHFGGAIINCMGMPIENFWNRTYSDVCRFSGDFMPEDRKWFIQHLLQCSYNSLTQGAVYTGDWDMWWSDDAQAKKNAVLRAMSGGPIYMSDELGRSIREVILPLAFSDGTILRLPDPAVPCRDCLFEDAERSGKIYKVFNKAGDVGIVAAFDLDENENPVSGKLSVSDIEGLKEGKYVVYDWFAGTAKVLEKGETLDLFLNNYDDFRLYILAPIKSGKALLGLAEKYIMPLTYQKKLLKYAAKDDGTLLVWSEKKLAGFEERGGGIWAKQIRKGEEFTF
ncbi:MAG: hypothetical protein MJ141_10190, partial [Clostridia bacterium]|nr:hypothetical protein [Clostridia bacterium]